MALSAMGEYLFTAMAGFVTENPPKQWEVDIQESCSFDPELTRMPRCHDSSILESMGFEKPRCWMEKLLHPTAKAFSHPANPDFPT